MDGRGMGPGGGGPRPAAAATATATPQAGRPRMNGSGWALTELKSAVAIAPSSAASSSQPPKDDGTAVEKSDSITNP